MLGGSAHPGFARFPALRRLLTRSDGFVRVRAGGAWDAEIRTVEAGRLGGWEHALTSRTPWVFVIDEAGVILAEGHGSRIAELGAVLVDAHQEPPAT